MTGSLTLLIHCPLPLATLSDDRHRVSAGGSTTRPQLVNRTDQDHRGGRWLSATWGTL